jgi:predicted PurR-regulated permease PerM
VFGAGITTIGILLLVLGLVGASIEVYAELLSEVVQQLVQQQLSAIREQLPAILRPGEEPPTMDSDPPFDSTDIVTSLIGTVIASPLRLTLTVGGVVLIYLGLFITQQQRPRRQP